MPGDPIRLEVPARPGLVLRPLEPADEPELRRIRSHPEVFRWWDVPEEGWPWSDDPEANRLALELDGRVVGLIEFHEEPEPKYRHASIDVFLDPALRGRGMGTAAVERVVRHLVEDRGHHRITIDPAADNAAAIRSYEKAGFTRVGVMRSYERDVDGRGWHDSLLMELVVEPDATAVARAGRVRRSSGSRGRAGSPSAPRSRRR